MQYLWRISGCGQKLLCFPVYCIFFHWQIFTFLYFSAESRKITCFGLRGGENWYLDDAIKMSTKIHFPTKQKSGKAKETKKKIKNRPNPNLSKIISKILSTQPSPARKFQKKSNTRPDPTRFYHLSIHSSIHLSIYHSIYLMEIFHSRPCIMSTKIKTRA